MYWNCLISFGHTALLWLTLTWDVLKLFFWYALDWENSWLTLTWDVLKCLNDGEYSVIFPININMRCIEIGYINKKRACTYGLTLTWDVLK